MANLYHLSQNINNDYDTYDSCIVCAETEEDARRINPRGRGNDDYTWGRTWCNTPDEVLVKQVGVASPNISINSVVIASFNAG